MSASRSILLIIGGGIAAYKCLELIRRLKDRGIASRCILTKAGAEFITPLSVSSLAGERCFTDLFSLTDEADIGHIALSRSTDLLVVAPATADLIAKMANGLADDLASTVLLATDRPVLIAPAMNPKMWAHPATQRNFAVLQRDGIQAVGPMEGEMAESGERGRGRMAEPLEIVAEVEALLDTAPKPLAGKRAIVTSGPTHEPIDPVRYIANRSSGAQGTALAAALRDLGARVTFVTGPASVAPRRCRRSCTRTFRRSPTCWAARAGRVCQAPKKMPIWPLGGSARQKRQVAGRSDSSSDGGPKAVVRMWRGSIHSLSRFTVSPLPAPSTPAMRMSTGKRPSSFRSYCAFNNAARRVACSRS